MFREKDKEQLGQKQLSQVNEKINELHTKIFNSEILNQSKKCEYVPIAKI